MLITTHTPKEKKRKKRKEKNERHFLLTCMHLALGLDTNTYGVFDF